MRGQLIRKVWPYDPALHAAPRYRRACEYEAFVPELLTDLAISLPGDVATLVSEADRKSTRLNSSHVRISYAVFCLKKKNKNMSSILARFTVRWDKENRARTLCRLCAVI